MYDLLCQLSGVAHPGILPDLLNLWNKHYKHELFCVREQRALGCRRVSSKEKSRYPGRISGNDRPGGAVTQQRWHALNVGERLWFRFARITGREILGPEWDGLTLLGKLPQEVSESPGFSTVLCLSSISLEIARTVCALVTKPLHLANALMMHFWPEYLWLS